MSKFRPAFLALLVLGLTSAAAAQTVTRHRVVPLKRMPSEQWIQNVSGDPDKPGPFVIRIHNDAGFVCPPHTHPGDEHIVVVQGTWSVGMGNRVNKSALEIVDLGAYAFVPTKMAHFCQSKTETILQVHGIGPFSVDLVDPAYELTLSGVSPIAGFFRLSAGRPAADTSKCFQLRIGDRVKATYGIGRVVGAHCYPASSFTQYWVQQDNGERFWATLQELTKL